jgi:predicted nucleic acid-binding protein
MCAAKAFVDTNIFVYLYSDTEATKQQQVWHGINKFDRVISTQVINEFCNVCIRKIKLPLSEVKQAVVEICDTCNLDIVDDVTVIKALELHENMDIPITIA